MNLKSLINKSYYGSVSYIGSLEDLNTIEQYILFNSPTLKEFKNIIIATNYSGDFRSLNTKLWKKYFPDCILIDLDENRGHSFGTADLDNAIINYCHSNNIDWVCKSSQDIIIEPSILEIPIKDGNDFYYMNGIGYGGMVKYNFNLDRIINEDFYPQTNFYPWWRQQKEEFLSGPVGPDQSGPVYIFSPRAFVSGRSKVSSGRWHCKSKSVWR